MKCPRCKADCKAEDNYCTKCGEEINENVTEEHGLLEE